MVLLHGNGEVSGWHMPCTSHDLIERVMVQCELKFHSVEVDNLQESFKQFSSCCHVESCLDQGIV